MGSSSTTRFPSIEGAEAPVRLPERPQESSPVRILGRGHLGQKLRNGLLRRGPLFSLKGRCR